MRSRLLALAGAALASLSPTSSRAADHADGPAATAEPAADLTDVFAWTSSDASKVYFVLSVFPNAMSTSKFSNTVQYVLHTQSRAAFGSAAGSNEDIVCTFDAAQKISCWAGGEYVTGDASATAGISSASGKLKVFAGLRDDPFFFNLDGFKSVASTVKGAKGSLTFDAAGCPALDAATSNALVTQLGKAPGGGTAVDHFNNFNALSIVLAVDKTILTQGGSLLSVWASTNRKP